jgi:hypothetical protein
MLDKTFDPASAEPRLYARWEQSGAFQPTTIRTPSRSASSSRRPT